MNLPLAHAYSVLFHLILNLDYIDIEKQRRLINIRLAHLLQFLGHDKPDAHQWEMIIIGQGGPLEVNSNLGTTRPHSNLEPIHLLIL